jgi:Zn-dependent protease
VKQLARVTDDDGVMRVVWWVANWWLLVAIIVGLGVSTLRAAQRRQIPLAAVLGASSLWLVVWLVPAAWAGQNHRERVRSVDVVYTRTPLDVALRPEVAAWLEESIPRQKAFAAERRFDGRAYLLLARRQSNRDPAVRLDELLGGPGDRVVTVGPGELGGAAGCGPMLEMARCAWADAGTSAVLISSELSTPELGAALAKIRSEVEVRADRYHPFREAGRFMLTLLGAVAAVIVSLIIHELGHAAMAKLLGCELLTICVGAGRQLLDRDIGSRERPVRVLVRLVPIGGYIQNVHRDGSHFRRNQALVSAAGPGANFVLGAILAAVAGPNHPAVLLNILLGLANLVPYSKQIPGVARRIGTDGYQVIEVVRGMRTFDPASAVAPFLVRAEAALDRRQESTARTWIGRGLSQHPDDPDLRRFAARFNPDLSS